MVIPMILVKIAAQYWPLISCYRAARKIRSYVFLHRRSTHNSSSQPSTTVTNYCTSSTTSVPADQQEEGSADNYNDNFCGSLLCRLTTTTTSNCSTPFPYFMLVAFEGGSLLRALLLLLSTPLLCAVGYHAELSIRIMVFITFCGLKVKDVETVARAVLPKFYLENLHLQHAYKKKKTVMAAAPRGGRLAVFSTSLPRVMVAGFLKEYLGVDAEVVGAHELKVTKGGCYFTGLLSGPTGLELEHKRFKELEHDFAGETRADVGLRAVDSCYNVQHDHLFFLSHCKEAYIVNKEERTSRRLAKDEYPKPLIFHDSRLAFLPTPLSTFSLFLFLPLLIPLSVARIFLGIVPPYKLIFPIAALTGTRFRVHGHLSSSHHDQTSSSTSTLMSTRKEKKGVLYVCNHRTLLDPVMLATALQRPIPAVTYSVSPVSEAIAPMRTVRLTRNRETDADTMRRLLEEGDLTICPEGTTCREPYLLRFSPLFAEIADKIVPAAMDAQGTTWFYGTTASGFKSLDPLFFFMNPTPAYRVRLLDQLPEEFTCGGGGWTASEVANRIQKQLGDALGFQCTCLTRKDKYMMLAGNQGLVAAPTKDQKDP
ncbi:glycerol-3-phosphate acyltransferase 1-like [Iris pallida]|uniref:Glycerol-3-phosphate acyltransferase 1-like n=1 Tax=Iris pallida TaxID=29817 RepID=A0AAX6DXU0_IRIPA|nr:glycerol-3-phosphate acyltransferase 1-like [Iris pallida]